MAAGRIAKGCLIGAALALVLSHAPSEGADSRAAKKEGEVVWYSALLLDISQAVCNNFNKKQLGVKCTLHRAGSGSIYRRYLQEEKAKLRIADVFHNADLGQLINLRKGGHLRAYRPAGIEKFAPGFITPDNAWAILRVGFYVPAYNTRYVKPGEAPRRWSDFADPKWKGRLSMAHPGTSGFTNVGVIAVAGMYGWDFFKKLAAQGTKVVESATGSLTLVTRGEAHASFGTASYGLFNMIKKGEPLKMVVPEEGVPLSEGPNAIFRNAPHPNAAEVFTDYLFSLEVQQLLVEKGLHVGHPGVKYPKEQVPLDKFKLIVVPPEEIQKRSKEVRDKFREIFGI